jgi:hypothetical protein
MVIKCLDTVSLLQIGKSILFSLYHILTTYLDMQTGLPSLL